MARKKWSELDLMDNELMDIVASDPNVGVPFCRRMLSVLLDREIGEIRVHAQRYFPGSTSDKRGVRLDVEVEEAVEETTRKVTQQVTQQVTHSTKVEAILELLEDADGEITESLKARLEAISDPAQLKRLLKWAARVGSVTEFEEKLYGATHHPGTP